MFVQGNEVEGESLDPQVLVRLEELAEQSPRRRRSAILTRSIGRSPEMPYFQSSGLSSDVVQDGIAGAKPRIAVEQATGQPLKAQRIFRRQSEMAQFDLTVRAGERERSRHGASIAGTCRSDGAPSLRCRRTRS